MPLATFSIENIGEACPFSNASLNFTMDKGQCVWLKGPSGVGKTTIAHAILKLQEDRGIRSQVQWEDGSFVTTDKIGMLFQQGVLVDSLNLRENFMLSCEAMGRAYEDDFVLTILKKVGLDEDDLYKMPGELSGGMLRRASLLQVMLQRKEIIILDEPFVGLDSNTAQGIVDDLKRLMGGNFAFILISHQEVFAKQLATPGKEVEISPKVHVAKVVEKPSFLRMPRNSFLGRTIDYIKDYLGISMPLIILAFVASGLAICLPFAELLVNLNVTSMLHQVESSLSPIIRWMVTSKVDELVSKYLPVVNREVYAVAIFRAFMIELGPFLTALLLAGRIGGSYSGEVGMMEATNQNHLLKTLGINPKKFNFYPALIAAVIAAPILSLVGTFIGLIMGAFVGALRHFKFYSSFGEAFNTLWGKLFVEGSWIKIPLFVNVYRSLAFILIIMFTAEILSKKWSKNLQPRDVPKVITWTVVISCLLIILADWALTEIYIN